MTSKPWQMALLALALAVGPTACKKGEGGVQLPTAPPAAAAGPGVVAPEGGEAVAQPAPPQHVAREVVVTGTTEAHRTSTLKSKVTGVVAEVLALDGQAVKAGDVLVKLDTSDLELHLSAARAGLRFAQAQEKAVRIEAARATKLVASKALPKAQQEQAVAQLDVASAGVGQARVAVKMASKAIADADVAAPYDAVVVMRHVAEGDYAAAMPPQPLVTLQEVDPIDVRVIVPAVHQALVRKGGEVTIRFPHTGLERVGLVDRVVPSIDPRTRSFSAIVVLKNTDGALLPGMFAEVVLTAASAHGAPEAHDPEGAR